MPLEIPIKRVPPGYKGVRITFDKIKGPELEPDWYVTDPFRTFQKIALADMRPTTVTYPGIGEGLLGDGTKVSGDVALTLEPLSARDMLEKIELSPVVSLSDTDSPRVRRYLEQTVGTSADYATTEATPEIETIADFSNSIKVTDLRKSIVRRAQDSLDEAWFTRDSELLNTLKEANLQGRRAQIPRGVLVTQAAIGNFRPSEEVVESMQEKIGAVHRAQAEIIMQDALQENYPTYTAARAARESAELGAIPVISMGTNSRDSDPASSATLSRMASLEKRMEKAKGRMNALRQR